MSALDADQRPQTSNLAREPRLPAASTTAPTSLYASGASSATPRKAGLRISIPAGERVDEGATLQ